MADKRVIDLTEKAAVEANDYLIVDNSTGGTKKLKVSALSDSALSGTSENPVQNKAVKVALDGKQDSLTFDSTPTASSINPVTSGGVKTALDAKQDTLTAGDNITISNNRISANVTLSAAIYTKTVDLAYSASRTIALDMSGYTYAATDGIEVYINGLRGVSGTDYTISVSGSSASVVLTLTGTSGITEKIEIIATKYS